MLKSGNNANQYNLTYLLVASWAFLMLQADLKISISPYIHWILSMILIIYLILSNSFKFNLVPRSIFVGMFLFLLGILVSGILSDNQSVSIQQTIKYSAIFLIMLLMHSRKELVLAASRGLQAGPIANGLLLLLGLFLGLGVLAELKGAGRWGTFANYPGSLWKVGMIYLIFSSYCLFHRKNIVLSIFVLISSIFCIFMDNSRTAFLSMVTSSLVVIILFLRLNKNSIRIPLTIFFGTCLLALVFIFWQAGTVSLGDTRISTTIDLIIKDGLISGLAENDLTRSEMNEVAIQQIQLNPFTGRGFGKTTIDTAIGPMVVHNSYTQSWADLGILGIIGYLLITFSWISRVKFAIVNFHISNSVFVKAMIVNSIFVLINYNIIGLLHPLSSEWAEWSTFLIFNAIFYLYSEKIVVNDLDKEEVLNGI